MAIGLNALSLWVVLGEVNDNLIPPQLTGFSVAIA
jgi:hypothetical protein